MGKVYLQIEGKTARIYQYSKTDQEGFEKHESSNGNVTYRKYWNTGLYGTLLNVSIRDSKIGKQIVVTVKLNGDYVNLQLPLYTQTGNIDNRYAESLIRFLPNLKKGEGYRFYPYAMEQEDSEFLRYGVSIIKSPNPEAEEKGEKVEAFYTYSKDGKAETDIPNLVWAVKAGKNKPTAVTQEAKDDFLYTKLEEATNGHLKYEGGSSSNSSSNSSKSDPKVNKPKEEAPDTGSDDDYDDLPF